MLEELLVMEVSQGQGFFAYKAKEAGDFADFRVHFGGKNLDSQRANVFQGLLIPPRDLKAAYPHFCPGFVEMAKKVPCRDPVPPVGWPRHPMAEKDDSFPGQFHDCASAWQQSIPKQEEADLTFG
jgi:hypothetical protein